VLGVVGYVVLQRTSGPDDVAIFGDATFKLCSQASDNTQGGFLPNAKVFPIDDNTHSRHTDIYNRLPAARRATTKAELSAVICVRDRLENVSSETYYVQRTGKPVAGCVLERHVTDLYLVDVRTGQTIVYEKLVGQDPKVGCPDTIKGQMTQRGDPISIDKIMAEINGSLLTARATDIPTALPQPTTTAQEQPQNMAKFVFTCKVGDKSQIFTMLSDGSTLQQLTQGTFNNYRPTWSPDGKQIAFHSDRSGNLDVYIMNADGTNVRRLTATKADDMSPTWSFDGKWIAFSSKRGGSHDIFISNLAGTSVRYITTWASQETAPSWSPDGKQVLFLSDHDGVFNVYRVNADGTNWKQLTFSAKPLSGPAWSPDGTQIAYADPTGIWLMDKNGGGIRRLTTAAGEGTDPTWSADGTTLVFASSVNERRRIYTVATNGGTPTQLTSDDRDCWQPDWVPNPE
jgi:TolB protein